MSNQRVGTGFDVHRFGAGDHLMLGGVRVPHVQGVVAHSDGDVLIHALCDALLGAAGLGDIGQHFPDTDPQYKGISSLALLRVTQDLLRAAGWRIVNVDLTLLAQVPQLAPFKAAIRQRLAETLGLLESQVNIKATTTERLGYIGRAEGVAAQAVCLLAATAP
jgi:2-C-methyl-D-erythritol 2,4-cyclodiphosphate synthase